MIGNSNYGKENKVLYIYESDYLIFITTIGDKLYTLQHQQSLLLYVIHYTYTPYFICMSLMITAGITVLHEKRDDNPFGTPGLSQFFLY
jgi:hypothetical protein